MRNHTSLIETLLAVLAAPATFLAPRVRYSRPRMTGDPSPEKLAQLDAERLQEAEARRLRKAEKKAENLRRSLKAKGESPSKGASSK